MGLGNPVQGYIQPNEAAWDGKSFRVTSTFQQHAASGRALGIDFGNGRCGDSVMAMDDGLVTWASPLGLANVVRVRHANGYTSGYAHLSVISVNSGNAVSKGQVIGQVGKTGADACHLHGGYTDPAGNEQDFWPLLDQNQQQAGDDMDLKGKPVNPVQNRKTAMTAGIYLVTDPTAAGTYENLRLMPVGQVFVPDWLVKGNEILGTDQWYGGWEPNSQGGPLRYGYLSVGGCGPLEPIEVTGGDTTAAYNDGVAAAAKKATEAKK